MLQSIIYPFEDDILVQEERSILDSGLLVLVLADWLEAGGTVSMIVLEMSHCHIHIFYLTFFLWNTFQWGVIVNSQNSLWVVKTLHIMVNRIVASTPVYEFEHVEILRDVHHFIVLVFRQPKLVIKEVSIFEFPADWSTLKLCEVTD